MLSAQCDTDNMAVRDKKQKPCEEKNEQGSCVVKDVVMMDDLVRYLVLIP